MNKPISQILRNNELIYHSKDLGVLWGISNQNTLYTTLKRYCQKGLLFRIYKGMYSIKPINEIHPWLIGIKAIHNYAYISTETVLIQEGLLMQDIPYITLVCSQSKEFEIAGHKYRSRQLQDKFLFQNTGLKLKNGVLCATPQRALADLLYFNPLIHIDNQTAYKRLNVSKLQKEMGYNVSTQP